MENDPGTDTTPVVQPSSSPSATINLTFIAVIAIILNIVTIGIIVFIVSFVLCRRFEKSTNEEEEEGIDRASVESVGRSESREDDYEGAYSGVSESEDEYALSQRYTQNKIEAVGIMPGDERYKTDPVKSFPPISRSSELGSHIAVGYNLYTPTQNNISSKETLIPNGHTIGYGNRETNQPDEYGRLTQVSFNGVPARFRPNDNQGMESHGLKSSSRQSQVVTSGNRDVKSQIELLQRSQDVDKPDVKSLFIADDDDTHDETSFGAGNNDSRQVSNETQNRSTDKRNKDFVRSDREDRTRNQSTVNRRGRYKTKSRSKSSKRNREYERQERSNFDDYRAYDTQRRSQVTRDLNNKMSNGISVVSNNRSEVWPRNSNQRRSQVKSNVSQVMPNASFVSSSQPAYPIVIENGVEPAHFISYHQKRPGIDDAFQQDTYYMPQGTTHSMKRIGIMKKHPIEVQGASMVVPYEYSTMTSFL